MNIILDKINKIGKIFYLAVILLTPFISLAQNKTISDILDSFSSLLGGSVIVILFSIALVTFIWGVIRYVINADNEEERKKGKQLIIWGIIGLFVISAIWGIVLLLAEFFGVGVSIGELPSLKQGN